MEMAKIDVTKIEGYAEMSAEDKLKALEAFEMPDPDFTGWVKKDVFDKKASEAAGYKKQLDASKTDEQKAKEETEARMKELQEKVDSLEKEKLVSTYKAKYLAQGMDEKLAADTAEALQKGDHEKVFANEKAFLDALAKKIKADALGELDKPPMGDGDDKGDNIGKTLGARKAASIKAAKETLKNFQ